MQIFVRVPGGNTLALDVDSSMSVSDLKTKIEQSGGVTTDCQRLLFENKELANEDTLSFEDGSCVDLDYALLGGVGPSDIPDHLRELAQKYKTNKMICRKCYARLPPNAHNCRKRKCGHCANIRPKKKIKEKEKGK